MGGGTRGDAAGTCDTEKFTANTNAATLCGRNDWHLPHFKALEGIAHLGVSNRTIDSAWFPNTPASLFWSGTPTALCAYAWGVLFEDDNVTVRDRSYPFLVRLVRAGQ